MRIYTLVSHDCRILPYQIPALRKCFDGAIHAVVGPCGANPLTSAGDVTVCKTWADKNDIRLVDSPAHLAGLTPLDRVREIVKSVWDGKEDSIFVHGDLLPTMATTIDALLDGKRIAGRVYAKGQPTFTWLAIRAGESIPDVAGENFRVWDARRVGLVEYCDPCWLHLDKVGMSWMKGVADAWGVKMQLVQELLQEMGLSPLDGAPCVTLADLRRHTPRMKRAIPTTAPQEIPADFDPEQERRRMQQGGCCGRPSA